MNCDKTVHFTLKKYSKIISRHYFFTNWVLSESNLKLIFFFDSFNHVASDPCGRRLIRSSLPSYIVSSIFELDGKTRIWKGALSEWTLVERSRQCRQQQKKDADETQVMTICGSWPVPFVIFLCQNDICHICMYISRAFRDNKTPQYDDINKWVLCIKLAMGTFANDVMYLGGGG